jgi:hypothetical protein
LNEKPTKKCDFLDLPTESEISTGCQLDFTGNLITLIGLEGVVDPST